MLLLNKYRLNLSSYMDTDIRDLNSIEGINSTIMYMETNYAGDTPDTIHEEVLDRMIEKLKVELVAEGKLIRKNN